jgi:hypothetical protein
MSTKSPTNHQVMLIDVLTAYLDLSCLLTQYLMQDQDKQSSSRDTKLANSLQEITSLNYQVRGLIEDKYDR